MSITTIRELPTVIEGERVRFSYAPRSKKVLATIIDRLGNKQPIRPEYMPREMRKIQNTRQLFALLRDAYIRAPRMDNGERSLYISQRGRGGQENEESHALPELDLVENIMQIVRPGLEDLAEQKIKENAVLLVGKTGVGKSMLGNLLCDIPLTTKLNELEYVLQAKDPIFAVSDSNTVSCTGCPVVHSPNSKGYTFIDTAGYDDTRLASQDIANAFFRKESLRDVSNMKSVFVARLSQIKDRDPSFVDTIHDHLQFLGIKNATKEAKDIELTDSEYTHLERIADSMVLVITGTPAQDNSKVRAYIKEKLSNYLKSDCPLSSAAKVVLRKIVDDERWDVFSAPTDSGALPKATDEKMRILKLIERSAQYVQKSQVDLQVRVNRKYEGLVQTALMTHFQEIKKEMSSRLLSLVTEHLTKFYNAVSGEKALIKFQKKYHDTITSEEPRTLTELLTKLAFRTEMLDSSLMIEAKEYDQSLALLAGLLPPNDSSIFSCKCDWLKEFEIREALLEWDKRLIDMTKAATVSQSDKILRLQGYFPRTSQLIKELANHKGFTEVEIHGLHSVIIDEDLTHKVFSGCNVTIIAPRWDIRNNRLINLSGQNSTATFPQATSATETGDSGDHGRPGENSESAGHFFGFGISFNGIEQLTIKANGGKGGPGQMGGAGRDGRDGAPARSKLDFIKDRDDLHKRHIVEATGWDFVGEPFHHGGGKYDTQLRNYGKDGQAGGNGGKGGAGGNGGQPGTIDLFSLSHASINIKHEENAGAAGDDGEAGPKGIGGRKGPDWEGIWHTRSGYCNWNGHAGCQPHHTDFGPRAASGVKPTDKNRHGMQPTAAQPAIDLVKKLYKYREYAIEMSHPLNIEAIEQFRAQYDKQAKITNKATVDTFFYECEEMEALYTRIDDKTKCLPLYRWMSERLAVLQVPNIQSADAALLQTLYTYTLSRIHEINAQADSRLIIDIKGYLKIVEKNIKQLHELDHASKVNFYEEQYVGELGDKIKQADFFLKTLSDDINASAKDFDAQIKKLVAEVESLKAKNSEKSKEYLEKREKLKEAIRKRKLFGALTIIAQCIGCCFPPTGPIVAGVVSVGLTALNNPQAAVMAGAQTLSTYSAGITAALQNPEFKMSEAHTAALARIRDITLTSAALSVVDAPGNSEEAQIEAMEKALKDIQAQQKLLDEYKSKVQTDFSKSLHEVVDGASKMQQALKGISKIALDFSRLSVRREFENIKRQVKEVVQSFEGSDGFLTIVQQLQEAIETTANIYDHIQEYEERQRMARYLARLAAPTAGDPRVTAYRQKVQRNVILAQYGRAFAAVRQWAFPFASIYLGDSAFLQQFIAIQSMDDFMKHVSNQLRLLQSKVKGSVAEINSTIDPIMWKGTFTRNVTNGPFFKWEGEKHKTELIDLLRGKATTLFADVTKMPQDRSAVKCSRIELQITSKDPHLRKELIEALTGKYITLRHSGLSYYVHEGKLYLMPNDRGFTLGYQFGQDGKTHESTNEVYNKMQGGNFLLSPYTHWIAQIEDAENLYKRFASDLDKVEIHLVGDGQYVHTAKAKGKKLGLNQYEHNRLFEHATQPASKVHRASAPFAPEAATNAHEQKDNANYLYQGTDIHAITLAPDVQKDLKDVYFIQAMQKEHLQSRLDELFAIVATGKPVVCVYNIGDYHWATFCLVRRANGSIVCLHKDSFGNQNQDLSKLFGSRVQEYKSHSSSEQAGDGTSCGIFAIENMRKIASGLKANRESFINTFESTKFCTLEEARRLRRENYASFCRQGLVAIEQMEVEASKAREKLTEQHMPEVEKILSCLQVAIPHGWKAQSEDLKKGAQKTISIQIGANDRSFVDYHYRIEASSDMSISQLRDILRGCDYGWAEGDDYLVEGRIIKVSTKVSS